MVLIYPTVSQVNGITNHASQSRFRHGQKEMVQDKSAKVCREESKGPEGERGQKHDNRSVVFSVGIVFDRAGTLCCFCTLCWFLCQTLSRSCPTPPLPSPPPIPIFLLPASLSFQLRFRRSRVRVPMRNNKRR